MSIEGRLTALQTTVEQLVDLVKETQSHNSQVDTSGHNNINESKDDLEYLKPVRSAQAEIRSLELWKSVVAECLGTLCYIFFICGVSIPWTGHFPPFLSVAFASALAYGAITYRVFPGAHLNPAFTLALAVIKCISPLRSILFLTAQAGGAIAGAALLFGLTVPGYLGSLGATTIASHVTPVQAFGMEFILCFVITLTFLADPRNSLPTSAVLLASNLVALPATGAGLNPVRSLGPAFVMNKWASHWVFWLGPILGSFLAAYLHKYILRRIPRKPKKVRENPSDGDSLDLPSTALPTATHDRLLCERFEPLYGGTRSLYMKPSPVLPRTNLSRSQSVYASKRLEYHQPKFEVLRKQTTPHSGPHSHHNCNDSNYEPLYERKSCSGGGGHTPAIIGGNLLISGPPSYESGYYKTYDTASGKVHGHSNHNPQGHHKKDPSDSRENHANRILAQYETSKGLVDVDPKAALKAQIKSAMYYEANEYTRKEIAIAEKKLIDTSPITNEPEHPPPPPRFRMQIPIQNQQRYQPPGQCSTEHNTDLSQNHPVANGVGSGNQVKDVCSFPKKPYEHLDTPTRKLLDFSPNHSQPNSLPTPNSSSGNSNNMYSARLLMTDKDSTYSRILEPLMNSKPLAPGSNPNGGNHCNRMSPNDQFMYSYH